MNQWISIYIRDPDVDGWSQPSPSDLTTQETVFLEDIHGLQ